MGHAIKIRPFEKNHFLEYLRASPDRSPAEAGDCDRYEQSGEVPQIPTKEEILKRGIANEIQYEWMQAEIDYLLCAAVQEGRTLSNSEHRLFEALASATEEYEDRKHIAWVTEHRSVLKKRTFPYVMIWAMGAMMLVLIMTWGALTVAELIRLLALSQ
jgi:hypothetical protein